LKVGPDPGGKDARSVSVVAIGSERNLRLRDWMDSNLAAKWYELSKGQLA